MKNSKISVVIPLFNKEQYIIRAIKSVLRQTSSALEIIVIDDGSSDKSAKKVRDLNDSKIILIQQDNTGVSAARNRGINESKGDLIAFLDADDEWKSDFLENILKLVEIFPYVGAYSTAYENIKGDEKFLPDFRFAINRSSEFVIYDFFKICLNYSMPICSSSVCIPRYIFDDIGFFKLGAHTGEDIDMWIRIYIKYNIAFSKKICSSIYKNIINCGSTKYETKKDSPYIKTIINAIENGLIIEDEIQFAKEFIAKKQLSAAKENLFSGNRDIARDILLHCETKKFLKNKIFFSIIARMPNLVIDGAFSLKKVGNKIFNYNF